ncbi:vomeronasal type-1 receptor 3-like [Sminthopsis crassicaudata]|uniref:vomeronasal type-1 receptor 3-like n=1 Tax=Sminthopsis crassicaudata TaxID=9301 RepID=UPI003D69C3D7
MTLTFTALAFCVLTVLIIGVFVKHKDTPIVKANNRTLSYTLLLSLSQCFLSSLLFIDADPHSEPEHIILHCNMGSLIAFYFVLGYMGILALLGSEIIDLQLTAPAGFSCFLLESRLTFPQQLRNEMSAILQRPHKDENVTSTSELDHPSIVFFIQTGAGMLGNFFLLCHYAITFFNGNRLRSIDSVFFYLGLANSIVLISKGVPQTMVGLGLKNFLDHIGCNVIHFLHRVARNVSLTITCFLSGFQIITISPFTFSIWSKLKAQASDYAAPFCLFCWILHILINVYVIRNMQEYPGRSNNTRVWNTGFCSQFASASFKVSLFVILFSIPDFLCVGFMVIASGYLVLLLQRHHQQVQHIHSSSHLSRRSPEIKATFTILVLVSTYVSFYSVNSVLSFYLFIFDKYYAWLIPISSFLAACFPAISPFVLISSDSHILQLFYSLWKNK